MRSSLQSVVRRVRCQRPGRLAQLAELPGREILQRLLVGAELRVCDRLLEPVEQGHVAVRVERLEHGAASVRQRVFELVEDPPEDAPLAGIEGVRVVAQVVDEHVQVPHRAQHPAQPTELEPQRLRPVAVQQLATHSQERPQPPRGHAHIVELLGIAAEPRSGIVLHDGPVLGLEHRLQLLRRGRVAARCRALRRPFKVERLKELRAAVALAGTRARSVLPSFSSPFLPPSTSSTSSSRNERTIFLSAMTETTSIVTSATAPVAASVRIPERFVRRTATGSRAWPRAYAASRSAISEGTALGGPGSSSSRRSAPRGSFSCQSPRRFSTRRRSVTPERARR